MSRCRVCDGHVVPPYRVCVDCHLKMENSKVIPLTNEQLEEVMEDAFEDCKNLLIKKGADYSSDADRLSNFRNVGERLGMTQEQVLSVYMDKHQCAVARYCRDGKVDSEGIEGRIHDNINYLILLLAMVKQEKQEFAQ